MIKYATEKHNPVVGWWVEVLIAHNRLCVLQEKSIMLL